MRAVLLDPARKRTRVARELPAGPGRAALRTAGASWWRRRRDDARPAGPCAATAAGRTGEAGAGRSRRWPSPSSSIVERIGERALSDPEFVARLSGEADRDDAELAQRAEIAAMEASLAEAANDYYGPDKFLSRAEFLAGHGTGWCPPSTGQGALASTTAGRPLAVLAGLDRIEAQWDGLGSILSRRWTARPSIDLCIESVTIASANGRGRANFFDASRVGQPVWRA